MRCLAVALGVTLLVYVTTSKASADQVVRVPPAVSSVPVPLALPAPVVTGCWLTTRLFDSLVTGPVEYCRGHLGYTPGALDCFSYTERVCSVFLPASLEWIETRNSSAPSIFPCPDAPEPPVCPRFSWR